MSSAAPLNLDSDERWKTSLTKSNKSLLITIHNTTTFALQLSSHDIQRGSWSKFPPESVPSGMQVQFGAESQNLSGSAGSLSYVVDIRQGDQIVQHTLPLSWSFSIIGKPQFQHKIWSMEVLNSDEKHCEVKLSLSSDESFVLETNFVKIAEPTSDLILEEGPELDENGKAMYFMQESYEIVEPTNASTYPAQLELLD